MKKRIALLAVACMMFASMGIFAACGGQTPPPSGDSGQGTTHTHNYGNWIIEKEPTATEKGSAKRTCTANDDGVETKELPVLTDTSFWTKDTASSQAPTHTAAGKDVYKNAEYALTVEVTLPANADAHSYGAWSWKGGAEPTLEAGATAQRTCTDAACGHVDELEVPALDETEFWTKDAAQHTDPTHTAAGKDVYTNAEHGLSVEVELPADADAHTWSAWSWQNGTAPTETAGATAERSCACGETETVEVKELTDTSEWTLTETPADYVHAGKKTYTHNTYAELTVELEGEAVKPAPYTNGDYYVAVFGDAETEKNHSYDETYNGGSWVAAHVPLTGNESTAGSGYPFNQGKKVVFEMTDPETGAMQIKIYDAIEGGFEETPEAHLAYVDMRNESSKLVVMAKEGQDFSGGAFLLMPYGALEAGKVTASTWTVGLSQYMAITYKYTQDTAEKSVTMYVAHDEVYFGAELEDLDGAAVAAKDAYHSHVLFVKHGGETLGAFGYNGTNMVTLDEYVGTYTAAGAHDLGALALDGQGGVTLTPTDGDPITGTYEAIEGEDNKVGITYEDDDGAHYYTVTLHDGTYEAETQKVTVTYHVNGNTLATAPQQAQVDKGAPMTLDATFSASEQIGDFFFRGWYTDAACTQAAALTDGKFIPSADTDLYAKWAKAIKVKTQNVFEESDGIDGSHTAQSEHTVAVGDNILSSLPDHAEDAYDEETEHSFVGWYIRESGDGRTDIQGTHTFSEGDENRVFYADWKYTPYVGTYYGYRAYGAETLPEAANLTIDAEKNITGKVEGTVKEYAKTSGLITWQDKEGNTKYFYYDAESGLIAYNWDDPKNNYLGSNLAIMSKYAANADEGKITIHYGIKAKPKHDSGLADEYCLHLVQIKTKGGNVENVLVYDTAIYAGVTITNGFGETLRIDDPADKGENIVPDIIKRSKTLIVTSKSGEVLVQLAAFGDTFGTQIGNNDTHKPFDAYHGVYTSSGETLKLDGAGNLKLGDNKTGTYAEIDKASKKLGLYVLEGDKTVYYEATLTESTYTSEKIMVDVTVVYGVVSDPTNKLTENKLNKNVANKLPVLEDPEHVYLFRGWFTDGDFTHECREDGEEGWTYKPTTSTTVFLYAKWVQKVTIKLHYNDKDQNSTVETIETFGVGETATISCPVKDGFAFAGWYTDDGTFSLVWGETDPDTGVTTMKLVEGTTKYEIYAKWSGAALYSGTYYSAEYTAGSSETGNSSYYRRTENPLVIDEFGKSETGLGVWPLAGTVEIKEYNAEEHSFNMVRGTSTYAAVIDPETKVIIMNRTAGESVPTFKLLSIFIPANLRETMPSSANDLIISSTYWEKGNVITLSFIDKNETWHHIFIKDGKIYFGVVFKNGSTDEAAEIQAKDCNKGPALYVMQDGEVLFSFGYADSTMKELDGYQGEYTLSGNTVDELSGTLTLNGISKATFGDTQVGSYTKLETPDNTFGILIKEKGYYVVTLSGTTYTIVKPMTSVTFESTQGLGYEGGTLQNGQYNTNFQVQLPKLEDTKTHFFDGWYTTDDHQGNALEDGDEGYCLFTPTGEALTLYAKWTEKVTVTVVYQKDNPTDITDDNKSLELRKGELASPKEPGLTDGQAFKEWRLNSPDGSVWTPDTPVTEDITIYCIWQDAHPLYGDWVGVYVGASSAEGQINKSSILGTTIQTFDADGRASGNASGAFSWVDEESGTFTIGSTYGAVDLKNGVLMVANNASAQYPGSKRVFVRKSDTVTSLSLSDVKNVGNGKAGCYWKGAANGSVNIFEVTDSAGSSMYVFVYDGRIWGNVSFIAKDADGNDVTISNIYNTAKTLAVFDSDGNLIHGFTRSDSALTVTELDGNAGVYQVGGDDVDSLGALTVDGSNSVKFVSGKTGTYTVADGSAGYTIDVVVDGTHYHVTLNKDGQTYTYTKE